MLHLAPLVLALLPSPELSDDGFVPLFNGRDLAGWVPVNTGRVTWNPTDENEALCSSCHQKLKPPLYWADQV